MEKKTKAYSVGIVLHCKKNWKKSIRQKLEKKTNKSDRNMIVAEIEHVKMYKKIHVYI